MTSQIAQWNAEHSNFSLLFFLLEEEVARLREGESSDYNLMLEIATYLREFGDCYHHPREDAAFEILVAREPSLRLPINRVLQEHHVIAAASEDLVARLHQIIGNANASRAGVEAAAALYLAYYRHHLAMEEGHVFPRLRLVLTEQDWRDVEKAAPSHTDPLFANSPTGTTYLKLFSLIGALKSA